MWTGSGSALPSPPDALKAPTYDLFTVLGPPPPTSYSTFLPWGTWSKSKMSARCHVLALKVLRTLYSTP